MMRTVLLLGIFLFLTSCGKDPSGVPDVPVNFRVSTGNPAYSGLAYPGNHVEVTGYGVAGLIIYHSAFGGLVAYDRCSTVNPERKCAVKIDETGITATDPCSGGIFSLEDGNPQKEPAKKPLKTYHVSENNGIISVIN